MDVLVPERFDGRRLLSVLDKPGPRWPRFPCILAPSAPFGPVGVPKLAYSSYTTVSSCFRAVLFQSSPIAFSIASLTSVVPGGGPGRSEEPGFHLAPSIHHKAFHQPRLVTVFFLSRLLFAA